MTLLELCSQLNDLDGDSVIFAERVGGEFIPRSTAVLLHPNDTELHQPTSEIAATNCPGLQYCLEVSLAKDAVAVWSQWREGLEPNDCQRAEAVCYKANYDAWGPPNFPTGGSS